jgi:hypothetical protein
VIHVQRFVYDGLHVDRMRAAHHQSAEHGLVRVARYGDLLARIHRGHHHALIAAGGSVDEKVTAIRAVGFGGKLLRFENGLRRLQQVVNARHRRKVYGADIVADEFAKSAIHADALLMARRMERNDACINVLEQGLKIWGSGLIH